MPALVHREGMTGNYYDVQHEGFRINTKNNVIIIKIMLTYKWLISGSLKSVTTVFLLAG
jgi:hypothetical protein